MATGLNFSGGSAGYGAPPAPSYGAPAPAPAPAPSYNAPAPAPSYNSFAKSRKVNQSLRWGLPYLLSNVIFCWFYTFTSIHLAQDFELCFCEKFRVLMSGNIHRNQVNSYSYAGGGEQCLSTVGRTPATASAAAWQEGRTFQVPLVLVVFFVLGIFWSFLLVKMCVR